MDKKTIDTLMALSSIRWKERLVIFKAGLSIRAANYAEESDVGLSYTHRRRR